MATRQNKKRPFVTHIRRAWDHAQELAPLALIPIVLSMLDRDSIVAVLSQTEGTDFDIQFPYPGPFTDSWSFTTVPTVETATVTGPGAEFISVPIGGLSVALLIGWLFVWAVLIAMLFAIYIAGIDRRFDEDPIRPADAVSRYGGRFLMYALAIVGVGFVVFLLGTLFGPAGFLLAAVSVLALGYTFYAVPFLFVAADAQFMDAVKRSFNAATGFGEYLRFFVGHLLVGAIISLPASLIVANTGIIGLVVAIAVLGPLALLFTAATYSFVHRRVRAGGI